MRSLLLILVLLAAASLPERHAALGEEAVQLTVLDSLQRIVAAQQ